MDTSTSPGIRIGELARRTGVSPDLIRAWERRYGLFEPRRSQGGFRLFSPEDEERVRRMRGHLDRGVTASEAARLASAGIVSGPSRSFETEMFAADVNAATTALADGLTRFDEAAAHAVLDQLFAVYGIEKVFRDVLLPFLHELGERWHRGETSVGQEHFASNLLMTRLLSLGRGWGLGTGPRAVLACAPAEWHELALVMFGLVLRSQGWRVAYLGADTPLDTLRDVVGGLRPRLTVVVGSDESRFLSDVKGFRALGISDGVHIAGAGATPAVAKRLGLPALESDPVTAALELASAA